MAARPEARRAAPDSHLRAAIRSTAATSCTLSAACMSAEVMHAFSAGEILAGLLGQG